MTAKSLACLLACVGITGEDLNQDQVCCFRVIQSLGINAKHAKQETQGRIYLNYYVAGQQEYNCRGLKVSDLEFVSSIILYLACCEGLSLGRKAVQKETTV